MLVILQIVLVCKEMIHSLTHAQYAIGTTKISSQSLECIEKPVTAEDLDLVLKGLAEFSEVLHRYVTQYYTGT